MNEPSCQELNYQDLVTDYYENLNNNLRNFKGGPGFLETWVHDEDHNRSLLEILDLAHNHGVDRLSIKLTSTVKGSLNLDWLRRSARDFGSLELKGESLTFTSSKGDYVPDEYAAIGESYIEGLKRHSESLCFEGALPAQSEKQVTVVLAHEESEGKSGKLMVGVNEAGLVTEARHQGFLGPERALMDSFCGVLIQRPLQEGAEHGAMRLEALLRHPNKPLKVKGLLTPETADPMFILPAKLARSLWQVYGQTQNLEPKRNFWRDPVDSDWLALSSEEKLKRASQNLYFGCRELGLQENVQIIEIKNDTRLVLSYVQDPEKPDFGQQMIKLEKWLRRKMGFEVELQLESIEDRNRREERTNR